MRRILAFTLLLMLLLPCLTAQAAEINPEYMKYCEEVGEEYGIQPEFLESFIEAESSGNSRATNGNCKGLMQVHETVHRQRMRDMGITDIYDPKSNIRLGASIIVDLYEQYGDDTAKVVMMYNGSSDAKVRAANFNFTAYADKVLNRAAELEEIHGKHNYSLYLLKHRSDERKRNKMEGL